MVKSASSMAIVCLTAEAVKLKAGGVTTLSWAGYGTLALIVFNAGLSIFGDAVRHPVHMDRHE